MSRRSRSQTRSSRRRAADDCATPTPPELEEAFFAGAAAEDRSVPPSTVSSDADELDEPRRTVRPERRAYLRRIVIGVVGVAALLSTFAVVEIVRMATAKSTTAMATTQLAIDMTVRPSIEPVAAPEPGPVVVAAPEPAPEPAPVVVAAPEPIAAAPEPGATAALDAPARKREAKSLIDLGKMRAAIPAAEAAIDADPGDAESYLLLGAALQEIGQWKRSIEVFSRCVREATRGPRGECRALGGH
jgi:tetratricopeptide (TPR) repeat protein